MKTEQKKGGTELKRCENAVRRKRSHRRTTVRRSSNVNFLLTRTVLLHTLAMLDGLYLVYLRMLFVVVAIIHVGQKKLTMCIYPVTLSLNCGKHGSAVS